ncbi:branched-chain amino acid ABC transporter permease [Marinobacter sp. R17]|nr:branched-chain amino acid ABC transporter permease [Marinobacter sp. R17]
MAKRASGGGVEKGAERYRSGVDCTLPEQSDSFTIGARFYRRHCPVTDRSVFKLTLPILFGYIPLGMAFGVLFVTQLDYPWWGATLMSLAIYAGAGQILAVSLLAAHAGLLEVFVALFVLNARHLFYGLSLLGRFRGAGWRKGYLIFGLTDETYSLLTSRDRTGDTAAEQRRDVLITLYNQSYWVIGSTLGAWLGRAVSFDSTGIEFALVALFIVLTIEQYKVLGQMLPIWIGAAAAGLSLALLPADQQLIGAVVLATLTLLTHYRFHRPAEAAGSPERSHG